ncbi:MAG: sugar ABC transporter permease, partial [Dactylosporangium sp.]|nr:sugar ABC transporter permease [Dactylosporangium sp.]
LQMVSVGAIAVGIVLVLLLGEIDLSAGSVSGVAGAVLAVVTVRNGLPDWAGILCALALAAAIGTLHGTILAWIGVPSFVVTLGGLMGWQGLQLWLLGPQGTINFPYNGFVGKIAHTNLTRPVGWLLAAVAVLLYLVSGLLDRRRRARVQLPARPVAGLLARAVTLAVVVFGAVAILNAYAGVPIALVILVGLVVGFDLVLRRTRFGRSIFALGGNIEAARRAGIPVNAIRISVFALASTLAAVGGILAASRLYSVGQSSGGSDTLLLAIAAAVIGGTSLFGGRGSTYSALLGALVLGSITSGMLLLSLDTSVRYMITAAVLVGAVVLDSLARRSRLSSGRE